MYRPEKAVETMTKIVANNRPNAKLKNQDADSDKLGIYINDKNFLKFYKKSVLTENPVADALGDEGGHAQRYINANNTVDFYISHNAGGGNCSWNPSSSAYGNWRKPENNGGIYVNNHIILRPEDMMIKMSSSQEFDNLWDKVMGNQLVQLIDKAAQAGRMLNSAKGNGPAEDEIFVSRYKKTPVLKDISTLTLPSSLKFNFQFGQAGLFSAEEEVVKPILAIANAFMPKRNGAKLQGTAPSSEYALNTVVKAIVRNLVKGGRFTTTEGTDDKGEAKVEVDMSLSGLSKGLTEIQTAIHNAFDSGAQELLEKSNVYKCIVYRIGRLQLPPLIVKDVSVEFDFSSVDEYGFPYKGSVSLDGLETTVAADRDQLGAWTLKQ